VRKVLRWRIYDDGAEGRGGSAAAASCTGGIVCWGGPRGGTVTEGRSGENSLKAHFVQDGGLVVELTRWKMRGLPLIIPKKATVPTLGERTDRTNIKTMP